MLPEIRHVRAFHAVARELSFRQASVQLGIAQPALSRTIKDLEAIMQVRLFERSTRVVGLTEPGKAFLKKTRSLISDLDEAVRLARQVQEGAAGELHVGFNDFAINGHLPEIVRRFRHSHPKIRVNLLNPATPEMMDSVLDGKLDAAFHMNGYRHPDLDHMIMRKERLVCVLPSSHRLAKEPDISLSSLADEPFVMGQWNTWKIYRRVIRFFCQSHGFDPKIIQEAVNSDGIIGFVAAEMGVTLYVDTEWIHHNAGVAIRPLKDPPPEIETVATWRRDRRTAASSLDSFLGVTRIILEQK